ncbi:MAG: DUF3466 family protein [Thermomicrobiales bacterium]|nr:DUF3466 family protein [Thermomicrobiales bacterium]
MKLRAITCAVTLTLGTSGIAYAAPTYNIIDLGDGIAEDINNFGQVVGVLSGQGGFLWTPATANGSTGGATILGAGSAWAINSMGQVVGSQGNSGFLWTPGVANGTAGASTTLTYPGATTTNTSLFGINDAGRVVGTYDIGSTLTHGLEWTPNAPNGTSGTFRDLGDLPNATPAGSNVSGATDINNANQAVGVSVTTNLATNPNFNAVLWQPGTTCGGTPNCTNIGDLAGGVNNATLHAINDGGVAVGFGSASTDIGGTGLPISHAMRWTPSTPNGATGTLADLGTLAGDVSSSAMDINNNGVIVGFSSTSVSDDPTLSRAMYWTQSDGMIELQSLVASNDPLLTQFLLARALGINDLGQIVGRGYVNGVEHAFLLVEAQPVPVPAAVWLLGSALLGVAGAARRQRRRRT